MAQGDKIENVTGGGMTEAAKEAFLLFQQMQSEFDANTLKLGAKVLEIPQPFVWDSKDKNTGEVKQNVSYKLVFGFTGGTMKEKVSQAIYEKARIGDKFLLEGYIKATSETKKSQNGEGDDYAVITLNPAITKITPLDLSAFEAFSQK